jgi:hypothetical protein
MNLSGQTLALICGEVKKMRNEMQNSVENTRTPVTIEQLQEELKRLEIQVAALSNANTGKVFQTMEAVELPHLAAGKCQMCKHCSHMRMPHRSNPHYTCDAQHSTIEPNWTCGLYHDKKIHEMIKSTAYSGH